MAHSNLYKTYIFSKEWRVKCKKFHSLTKNRCCLFPWLKSAHIHHLTYKHLTNERFIIDCVPLSKPAHKLIHLKILWKTYLRIVINYYLRLAAVVLFVLK